MLWAENACKKPNNNLIEPQLAHERKLSTASGEIVIHCARTKDAAKRNQLGI